MSSDTTRTYSTLELRQIALRFIQADQCDTTLAIINKQLSNEIKIVTDKNNQISDLNLSLTANNSMMALKDKQIKDIALFQKHTQTTLNWTRAGWIVSTVGIIVIFALIH